MNNSLRGPQCTNDKRKDILLLTFNKANMTEEESKQEGHWY